MSISLVAIDPIIVLVKKCKVKLKSVFCNGVGLAEPVVDRIQSAVDIFSGIESKLVKFNLKCWFHKTDLRFGPQVCTSSLDLWFKPFGLDFRFVVVCTSGLGLRFKIYV